MDTGLFDVTSSGVEQVSSSQAPWANSVNRETKPDGKSVTVSETKANKAKERKRYSQKLAKQLQRLGIDVDVVSGVENKSESEDTPKKKEESVNKRSPCRVGRSTSNKELLENVVDETLNALESRSNNMDANGDDDDESLSGWDPMTEAYMQKSFNRYQAQRYNDNFLEKHSPVCGPDGKKHISPTKVSSEDVRLYITNIPISLTEDGLENMFSSVGKCKDVKKCRMREGQTTTFGFVTYRSVREAERAIIKYNDFAFGADSKLRVKLAHTYNPASHEKVHWRDKNRVDDKSKDLKTFSWDVADDTDTGAAEDDALETHASESDAKEKYDSTNSKTSISKQMENDHCYLKMHGHQFY